MQLVRLDLLVGQGLLVVLLARLVLPGLLALMVRRVQLVQLVPRVQPGLAGLLGIMAFL